VVAVVKLDQVEVDSGADLSHLAAEAELIATEEEMVEPAQNKTGGLLIRYNARGKDPQTGKPITVPQKYGKLAGAALVAALRKLGHDETEALQKHFHHFSLTNFRTGYPRYIPDKCLK